MLTQKRLMKETRRVYEETVLYYTIYGTHDEAITAQDATNIVEIMLNIINTVIPSITKRKYRTELIEMRSQCHEMLLELDLQFI